MEGACSGERVDIEERVGVKIDSSTVAMGAARSYRETSATIRRFTIVNYREELSGGGGALDAAVEGDSGNTGNTEEKGEKEGGEGRTRQAAALWDWQNRMQKSGSGAAVRSTASQTYASIRHRTVSYIFNLLFSSRRNSLNQWMQDHGIQTYDSRPSFEPGNGGAADKKGGNFSQALSEQGTLIANMKVLRYSEEMIHIEAEDTSFSTVGTVRTSDGREIRFHVDVAMSRRFQQHVRNDLDMAAFTMCDPLVINLDTDMAELSDQKFYFDIDADGEPDEISGLGAGSGYLALDKNGDGIINDGSELFGTSSGNGFADLAEYDEDGNGWIDENDAIWDKLKIWCKDENGNDVLYSLSDKGVGAICLQNVSTDFTLKGEGGKTNGAIRNTGVFLYENGNVGTVQHVDVAKYQAQA